MPQPLFTINSILRALKVIIDFSIIWLAVYYVLKIVRNNSRTVQIFKGIILIIAVWYLSRIMGFMTLKALLDFVVNNSFLVLIIIFAPEIRGMLERLGKTSVFTPIHSLSANQKENLVDQLVSAVDHLAKTKTGALISLEQGSSLSDYIKTGTPINSIVTEELLSSIFVPSTPLHDGAVIIQGDRIACASAYFPPTSFDMPSSYGARHRAAIGISEISDSITIVVSEETGRISIAEAGKLREVDVNGLREFLNQLITNTESHVSEAIGTRKTRRLSLSRLGSASTPIKIEKLEESPFEKEEEKDSKFKSIFNRKDKTPKVEPGKETKEDKPLVSKVSQEKDILDDDIFSSEVVDGGDNSEEA